MTDAASGPAGPTGGAEPLPPRREQLPLPRRDGQSHIEPQLRVPGGTGSGTPFAAFGADPIPEQPTSPTALPRSGMLGRRRGSHGPAGPDPSRGAPSSGRQAAADRAAAFRAAAMRAIGRGRGRDLQRRPPEVQPPAGMRPAVPPPGPVRRGAAPGTRRRDDQFDVWGQDPWVPPTPPRPGPHGSQAPLTHRQPPRQQVRPPAARPGPPPATDGGPNGRPPV